MSAFVCLALSGCLGSRGNVELLEARLRQEQDRLLVYERQLAGTQGELQIARQEADILRGQLKDLGERPLPAEYTQSVFEVRGIQFNGLMTGGRNRDGQPGDDVLVAVVTPVDEHGDLVKLAGAIELEALDLTRPEAERVIARWTFSPEELRSNWRSGLFSAGYQFELPWPEPPRSEELLLHGRLVTADGRQFDASHTIKVKPAVAMAPPRKLEAPEITRPIGGSATPGAGNANGPAGRASLSRGAAVADDLKRPPRTEQAIARAKQAESPDGVPAWAREAPGSDAKGAAAGIRRAGPRPIPPDGLRTSDNWTDETIPRLR
jgi:hypothetical protein